jgi:hypothetical protein
MTLNLDFNGGATTLSTYEADIDVDISSGAPTGDVHAVNINYDFTTSGGAASLMDLSAIKINYTMDSAVAAAPTAAGAITLVGDAQPTTSIGVFSAGLLNVTATGAGTGSSNTACKTIAVGTSGSAAATAVTAGYFGEGRGGTIGSRTYTGTTVGVRALTQFLLSSATSGTFGVLAEPDSLEDYGGARSDQRVGFRAKRGGFLGTESDLVVTSEDVVPTTSYADLSVVPSHWTVGAEAGNGYFEGVLECDGDLFADNDATIANDCTVTNKLTAHTLYQNNTGASDSGFYADLATITTGFNITSLTTEYQLMRIDPSADIELRGIDTGSIVGTGADTGHLWVVNVDSAFTITVINESTATAAKRIITGTGGDVVLGPNDSAHFMYDNVTARWRMMG